MSEDRDISEWNGAADYLNRINMALLRAAEASMTLDIYNWLHSLKLFYREISSVMTDKERERLYKESVELSAKVNEYLSQKNNPRIRGGKQIDGALIEALEHFEIELRKIFKSSGLQLKLTDSASRALK